MILEEETFEKFGYHSKDLKRASHKKIVALCDNCNKERELSIRDYRKLCHKCALKNRKIKYPILLNKSWLHQKYIVEHKSSVEIASKLNCFPSTVIRHLSKCGIHTRSYGKTCKGKHPSLETRLKMSISRQKRINEPMKGKHHTKSTREQMSKSHIGIHAGEKNPNYGKQASDETRLKMSIAHKGKHHPNWKGGISIRKFEKLFGMDVEEWMKLSRTIRKRDNYTCQYCEKSPAYDVHHIFPKRIKIDNHPDNLITLCKSCHTKVEHLTTKYIKENKNPRDIFHKV